ncbi:hypothetical protein MANES_14G146932v8 [Manihot esculenta]|uniref:Uncharacterized protein n=1 Tax=Manihot esculenta TaxID=3983 RepID=A0ACB7GIC2_MANES|nr:hypothetical protein MANES_14G146932v8 [Manihot esculenta]
MERFFKKMSTNASSSLSVNQPNCEVDIKNLPSDSGLQPNIMRYSLDVRNQVRRTYLLKDGNRNRRFIVSWFDEFGSWLEYSITKNARSERGYDAFVTESFSNWRKKKNLREHVGNHNSNHNRCHLACQYLMNQTQHIEESISKQ